MSVTKISTPSRKGPMFRKETDGDPSIISMGRFIGKESFIKWGGKVATPHFSAIRADEEPQRIERLARVVKRLPPDVVRRLVQIHDHKGYLFAFFDTENITRHEMLFCMASVYDIWTEDEQEYICVIGDHNGGYITTGEC